ncbi:ketoacyl-ACP synthase III [Nocardia colli]|uniref:ketoacyl-ACP synthase III n=1 Tax=Nocardia colli TaxID=2545717 RepID=UPI0035D723CE
MELAVLGTGSAVPDRCVSNADIAAAAGVDPAWIVRKTGIRERRWSDPGQATSDLAVAAARQALAAAGIEAGRVALIIVATSTPDALLPPTASYVQRALGAVDAVAFDINSVCSGFVFALSVAQAQMALLGGYALVVGADTYSRILNPRDRKTVVLFGDGAGAVVVGGTPQPRATFGETVLFSFGELADLIRVPAGGSRRPYSPAVHEQGLHYFTMDGFAVRRFVQDRLPELIHKYLLTCTIPADRVRHLIPHQANKVLLDALLPHLELPNASMHQTVVHYGNTAAASIPITLDHAARTGALADGGLVLLVGFGGGMSVGLSTIEVAKGGLPVPA